MKKISDRERALEQSVWVGNSVVSRSDYLARLGLKAALSSNDDAHAGRRPHQRSIYSIAIVLFSLGAIAILGMTMLPGKPASCWLGLCHGYDSFAGLVARR